MRPIDISVGKLENPHWANRGQKKVWSSAVAIVFAFAPLRRACLKYPCLSDRPDFRDQTL